MNGRSKRLTAEQAIELFRTLGDEDSDSSSDDEFVGARNRSRSRSSSSESDESPSRSSVPEPESAGGEGALPQPGPSSSRGRSRVAQAGAKRRRLDPEVDVSRQTWESVELGARTEGYNFEFHPKNRREPGVNAELNDQSTALDCFLELFTDDVFALLISSINDYASKIQQKNTPARQYSRFKDMKPVDLYEMRKFLAVLLAMGLDHRPEIVDYWSTRASLNTPFYGQMFTRLRFETLYSTILHVGESDAEGKDKIEPFINLLVTKFNAAFTPFQYVSIDEMVVGFKGRFGSRQYNASKPKKHHIKSYGLVDSSTGYVCNVLTYFGADTSYDMTDGDHDGMAEKIFATLLKTIGKGYHIYSDRWYTNFNLLEFLLKREMYYTGTVQKNRKGFPPLFKVMTNKTMQHQESRYWLTGKKHILACAWQDKKASKPVLIVSTNAAARNVTVRRREKPSVIADYNVRMNGCDKADQMVGYYNIHDRKTMKWWKKLFHWAIELTINNAHILYVMTRPEGTNRRNLSLRFFKLKLIDELAAAAAEITPHRDHPPTKPAGRPLSNPVDRLEGAKHIICYVPGDRRCRVCSTPAEKRRTNFVCEGCVDVVPNAPLVSTDGPELQNKGDWVATQFEQLSRYGRLDAFNAVMNQQMSLNQAAKYYKVNKKSLMRRVSGEIPIDASVGVDTALSMIHEQKLVSCIKLMAEWGWGFTSEEIKDVVKDFVTTKKIETKFKDCRPGYDWLKNFLKRHPDITPRKTEQLSNARLLLDSKHLQVEVQHAC
ncbi:hypothetical protein EGW08_019706 [Elysia chlorotica]|uniref:HTH CENPB-type domain-containing protein n=1 Tax=Elysia chlorotica TaxID=188477 RepID=A0A3S0ZPX3_ELYCH|nr:hypothetical protein EGW08_019706 [Elysia chlorotica]